MNDFIYCPHPILNRVYAVQSISEIINSIVNAATRSLTKRSAPSSVIPPNSYAGRTNTFIAFLPSSSCFFNAIKNWKSKDFIPPSAAVYDTKPHPPQPKRRSQQRSPTARFQSCDSAPHPPRKTAQSRQTPPRTPR